MMSTYSMQTHHPYTTHSAASHWYSPTSTKRKRVENECDASASSDAESSSGDDLRHHGPNYNAQHHRPSNVWSQMTTQRTSPRRVRAVKRMKRDTADSQAAAFPGVLRAVAMENGFARMSLAHGSDPFQAAASHWPNAQPTPVDVDVNAPSVNEVHMKSRSWFEPEKDRIVVVDLDGSDTEAEDATARPPRSTLQSAGRTTDSPFAISQAYLDRLSPLPKPPTPPPTFSRDVGALILYKPPPLLPNTSSADDDALYGDANIANASYDEGPDLYATIEEVDDENDVQMMDIDE